MSQFAFLQTNAHRNYPFIDDEALLELDIDAEISVSLYQNTLPDSAVVDFGAMMGLNAEYDETTDIVYLYQVRRESSQLVFEFRTTAESADSFVLTFYRTPSDPPFTTSHEVSLLPGTEDQSLDALCDEGDVTWEGFLITGPLDDLLELLPDDGDAITFLEGRYQVEPGRIQNLANSFVRSINLANVDRTRAEPPEECGGEAPGEPTIYVNSRCITGDVRLVEGFNCSIRQETDAIVINAAKGGGAGLACDEVPLYPDEDPPSGSTLLTGGPSCNEIIRTINGVSGPNLQLQAGEGVDVVPHPTLDNTLLITTHLKGFALCDLQEDVSIDL